MSERRPGGTKSALAALMEKATKRPWKIVDGDARVGSRYITHAPRKGHIAEAFGYPEDARLICLAVNALPEMVTLLRDVASYGCECDVAVQEEDGDIVCNACEAKALIAGLEEEAGR